MVGYFANYAVPRLGEVTRCGILARYDKVPFAESLGTVIVERIIDVICFLLFVAIVFPQRNVSFLYNLCLLYLFILYVPRPAMR